MLTIAYLANQFPVAVEPYVGDEIRALRQRGVRVIAGSVQKPPRSGLTKNSSPEILFVRLPQVRTVIEALVLVLRRRKMIWGFLARVLLQGNESLQRRLKAVFHTGLGACYAVSLKGYGADHIHAHHGYSASWIGMVAARLLGIPFSMTLHGSDLLVDGAYLDTKLTNCRFCLTISEFNRGRVLQRFPSITQEKIIVSRLGAEMWLDSRNREPTDRSTLNLLSVGRLHAVKDHAFLIEACARLRDCGLKFQCRIAGEGPERRRLTQKIKQHRLGDRVTLLGHVSRPAIGSLYCGADVVVLTSRSEGIPLVLMEAMARRRIVIAPAITGIPELVIPGKTGLLYLPGALEDLVARILFIQPLIRAEDKSHSGRILWIRHAARAHVLHNFNQRKNLVKFCDRFLELTGSDKSTEQDFGLASGRDRSADADIVLQ